MLGYLRNDADLKVSIRNVKPHVMFPMIHVLVVYVTENPYAEVGSVKPVLYQNVMYPGEDDYDHPQVNYNV